LDASAAEGLLGTVAPDLTSIQRRTILNEAAGNPLALTELPRALPASSPELAGSGQFRLTRRLEEAARLGLRVSQPARARCCSSRLLTIRTT
jgi:hypothetical protein